MCSSDLSVCTLLILVEGKIRPGRDMFGPQEVSVKMDRETSGESVSRNMDKKDL